MKTKTPTTTTALALPAAAQAMQPKPTKTEIVEAMLARAKVKHDAENERRKKLREAIEKKIKALALKEIKTMKPSFGIYTYNDTQSSHCDVRFNRIKSAELDALYDQHKECSSLYWDEKETRAAIRRELSGIQKPTPTRLLDNPETVKAIDAMLAQWGLD